MRGFQTFGHLVAPPFIAIGNFLISWALLPAYKIIVLLRIRLGRVFRSARGFFFILFTNRYILHAAVILISGVTIAQQLQAKSATAVEYGKGTLLYSLVAGDDHEIIEEPIHPEAFIKDTHYIGTDTIQAVPDIDYDYEDANDSAVADLTLPGSIAVAPEIPNTEDDETPSLPNRTQTEFYTVQSGDSIGAIAHRFGVTVGTITAANSLRSETIIKPGSILKIPPATGVLYTLKSGDTIERLATKFNVSAEEIRAANRISVTSKLLLGEDILIPGAHALNAARPVATAPKPTPDPASQPVSTRKTKIKPGVPISRIANKSFDVYQELTDAKMDTRVTPASANDQHSTKLLWPTSKHIITQYYGWKHTGVDLDGDYTDPIYAAEDGIVQTAGWNNGGYGLQIIIDHENGYRTRYAHSSKLLVSVGDRVKRGQVIAMVGTTGRSTGTHLHFEVYVNGVRKNPLSYIR